MYPSLEKPGELQFPALSYPLLKGGAKMLVPAMTVTLLLLVIVACAPNGAAPTNDPESCSPKIVACTPSAGLTILNLSPAFITISVDQAKEPLSHAYSGCKYVDDHALPLYSCPWTLDLPPPPPKLAA